MNGLEAVRFRLVSGLLSDERSGQPRDAIQLPTRDPHGNTVAELQALLSVLPATEELLAGWSLVGGGDEVSVLLGPALGRVTLFGGTEMDWYVWWVDWPSLRKVTLSTLTIPHVLAPAKPSWILEAPPGTLDWYLFVEPNSATHVWKG